MKLNICLALPPTAQQVAIIDGSIASFLLTLIGKNNSIVELGNIVWENLALEKAILERIILERIILERIRLERIILERIILEGITWEIAVLEHSNLLG